MVGNRREFLRTSAAIGLLSASASVASAKPEDFPWIAFLHSTSIEPELEEAFLVGLRDNGNGWEADPTKADSTTPNRVIIRKSHGLGKYGRNHPNGLKNAAQDLKDQTPTLRLIVAAGGNVAAIAANSMTGDPIPILAVYGRAASAVDTNTMVTGFSMETPPNDPNTVMKFKIDALKSAQKYGVSEEQLCLFYNGNSQMAADQLTEWKTLTSNNGKFHDASTNSGGNNNAKNLGVSIDAAVGKTDPTKLRALVVSSDPFFTIHRQKIIRYIKRKNFDKLIVCYPFAEYFDDAKSMGFSTNDCMMYGPDLTQIYQELGTRAAQILSGAKPTDFDPRIGTVTFSYQGK
jgi:hypothetical protein